MFGQYNSATANLRQSCVACSYYDLPKLLLPEYVCVSARQPHVPIERSGAKKLRPGSFVFGLLVPAGAQGLELVVGYNPDKPEEKALAEMRDG